MWPALIWRLVTSAAWIVLIIVQTRMFNEGSGFLDATFLNLAGIVLILVFLIWIIGYFANRRPRSQGALQRVQDGPANGFEAWKEPPEGGLRPGARMRAVVRRLSGRLGILSGVLLISLWAISTAGTLSLLWAGQNWLEGHFPIAARPLVEPVTLSTFALTTMVMTIRSWALESSRHIS